MKVYKDGVEVVSLWQYDKNIALQFGGLDTTLQTQIQFGHGNDKTPAVTPTIETVGGEQRFVATVPNKLLEDGWDLLCYAYQSQGDSGWTETMVKIPVNERMPSREWIPSDDPGYIDLQDMRDDIDTLQAEMPLKEDVANKVTALNADVTDTQYPSAKAVFEGDELLARSLSDLVEILPEKYLSTDPGAVGTVNLADGAVTGAKIETGAVTGGKIASSAVTNPKIAANAVTGQKIAANSVSESHIVNGAVTASKIAPNAVHEQQIAPGAVVEGKIAASAVTPPKIANGAVTSDKLGAGAVTSVKLAPQLLQAIQGAEQQSHKVTSLGSTSTDTQYPSAKCVYDYGQSIQTAIEGDLDTVRAALGYTTP